MKYIGILFLILILASIAGVEVARVKMGEVSKKSIQAVSRSANETGQGVFNANLPAPELTGITAWLNVRTPLTLKSLQGKVVLIDFWTNQCINCIHTLPYVVSWYDRYKDKGLVIIGVHTPELAYERTLDSIKQAIQLYGIHYPVAQDNNYATWNAYSNQYWPGMYLIDKKGIIRRTYFGEGEYDKTELAIQMLLKQ